MSALTIPELPKLYYSTWGYDFYSEHWMAKKNCWMYSLLKFAEANIDLEKDLEAIAEQRAANASMSAQQDDSSEALQQARAELATLQSVQSAAYGGSIEPVMNWLENTGLQAATRLAQSLQARKGVLRFRCQ